MSRSPKPPSPNKSGESPIQKTLTNWPSSNKSKILSWDTSSTSRSHALRRPGRNKMGLSRRRLTWSAKESNKTSGKRSESWRLKVEESSYSSIFKKSKPITLLRKLRKWRKKVSYDCRKKVADSRLRIKGKFVTREQVCEQLGISDIDVYTG